MEVKSDLISAGHKQHVSHTIVKIASVLTMVTIILFATKNIWYGNGYIVFSDLDYGVDDSTYLDRIFGIFNHNFSSMNFFNLSRLVFVLPFYGLSLIFSSVPHFLLKSMIVGNLLIGASGMYKLCDRLIKGHFGQFSSAYHYIGLTIPAIYYGLNPWVVLRIQHVFLLPGYAVYPWVLYYFIILFRLDNKGVQYNSFTWDLTLNKFSRILSKMVRKKQIHFKDTFIHDVATSLKIAFFIVIGAAAIHYFFFIVMTVVALSMVVLVYQLLNFENRMTIFLSFITRHIILWGITFLFCSYWVIPYVLSTFFLSIEPGNVNVIDTLNMFSRYSSLKNIIYLISYWWPMLDYSYYLDTPFYIAGGILLFLIVYITLYRFSKHFYMSLFTAVTFVVMALATGVNSNYLAEFNVFIVTKLPIVGHIFRDPNKLVGILAAYLAVLLGFSVDRNIYLLRKEGYGRIIQVGLIVILLTCVMVYNKPFKDTFIDNYYKGVDLPDEYIFMNENHLDTEGKVLYMPNMEDMLLNNGVSNYSWNSHEEAQNTSELMKTVGNFHFYSSSKGGIFQHEGNIGMVSYMYTFLQQHVDQRGGQYLDNLLGYLGFDELVLHEDVLFQDQRLEFNKDILEEQKHLDKFYENNIFKAYEVKTVTDHTYYSDKNIMLSKGLYSFLYMQDHLEELEIDIKDTSVFWQQSRLQQVPIDDSFYILADDELEYLMPQIDQKYFVNTFDKVNSANPNTGWAKTKMPNADWFWLLNIVGLKNIDYQYDFGTGLIYTYNSNKLDVPSYELSNMSPRKLLSVEDIVDGFFESGNEDIFRVTVFPSVEEGDVSQVVYGETSVVENTNNLWQVAKSEEIKLDNLHGSFIAVDAVVSGVNSGSLHFKIFFLNERKEEVGVAYLSRGNEESNYKKSAMYANTYIPEDATSMRIDILNSSSITDNSYFWIHDFNVYNLDAYKSFNTLDIDLSEDQEGQVHGFARVFKSEAGNDLRIDYGESESVISLKSSTPGFEWMDLGIVNTYKKIQLIPTDGLTVIDSIIYIGEEEFQNFKQKKLDAVKGKQLDYSLFSNEFESELDIEVKDISNQIVYPNAISGELLFINNGELSKDIDILIEDEYKFSFTGNIDEDTEVHLEIVQANGKKYSLELDEANIRIPRTQQNDYFKVDYQPDKYYLTRVEDTDNAVPLSSFVFEPIRLSKGKYQVELIVKTKETNHVDISEMHLLGEGEIVVPPEMFDNDQYLMTLASSQNNIYEVSKSTTEANTFYNKPSESKLWMIYAFNQIKVHEGESILFRASVSSEGVDDLHSKMVWMDDNKVLLETEFVEFNPIDNEYYYLVRAKESGYIQPTFFGRSNGYEIGSVTINSIECYQINNFSKLEGLRMIPVEPLTNIKTRSKYLIYNESYNPLWRPANNTSHEPLLGNFFHNSYYVDETKIEEEPEFVLAPMFDKTYYVFICVSGISIIIGLIILLLTLQLRNDKDYLALVKTKDK